LSRLTTYHYSEPVPASTHSLAPVVSVATFSPGRQKVLILKRPRHDTQASPARPPVPNPRFCFACSICAGAALLSDRSHLLRCVDTFYRNCQPSTLDRPRSSHLRQDRTGRDSGAFSRLLYSCPKIGFEKKILHPSFFVRAAAQRQRSSLHSCRPLHAIHAFLLTSLMRPYPLWKSNRPSSPRCYHCQTTESPFTSIASFTALSFPLSIVTLARNFAILL
jgi:hypothetical protein